MPFRYHYKIFLFISVLLASLVVSCGSDSPSVAPDQRDEVDSLVKACKDTTALRQIIQKFKEDGNALGEETAYLSLGKTLREESHFMESIELHRMGVDLAKEIGDTLNLVQHLNNIGTNFRRLGILDEASTYHYMALTLCDEQEDTSFQAKKNRVVSLNGIGNIQLSLKNSEAADSAFRGALAGETELGSFVGMAINYANLGSIYEDKGQLDSARIYFNHSLDCNRKAESNLGISLCYTHFGRLFEKEKKWDLAAAEYEKAINQVEGSSDEWHNLEPMIALARVELERGNNAVAKPLLDNAIKIADNINSVEHKEQIHNLYYKLYRKQGDTTNALLSLEEVRKCHESIDTESSSSHMQNVRVKYEKERRQKQIDILQKSYDAERNARTAYSLLVVALILLAIVAAGVLHFMVKNRLAKQKLMEQMEKVRTNFFTNITHEFRTPLTVILGLSRDMTEGAYTDVEDVKKASLMINRQGNGLLDLVNQLLDISKSKSQIGRANWRYGNIVGFLNMIVESILPLTDSKKIEVIFAPREMEVMTDFVPDYVTKIARNLLSNALKYTPENGRILIASHIEDQNLVLRLTDNGDGIPEEDLKHIFKPFFQASNSKTEVGTGVGLSLVKLLIDAMGGSVTVHSAVGEGTAFTIVFPITHNPGVPKIEVDSENNKAKDAVVGEVIAASTAVANEMKENTGLPILLVVEDNPDVSAYMKGILMNQYEVHTAFNGKEGYEKALTLVPDLVITDVMMPEMDGTEMCRLIRNNEVTNHIPLIMVTAKVSEEARIEGLEMGADAYVSKPFSAKELRVRVSNLIEQRKMLRAKYQVKKLEDVELPATDEDESTEDKFLVTFVDVILKEISVGRSADVDSLSDKMRMTPRQLSRKIQSVTGDSIVSFVTKVRVKRAKRLMTLYPDMQMAEVAFKSGFADSAYFSRTFKQQEGVSPSQWKKQNEK